MEDVKRLLRRDIQLDLLAYVIIVALLIVISLLTLMIISGLRANDLWLLKNENAQVLFPLLLCAVVLYMADTHRRLRQRLANAQADLLSTRDDLAVSRDRIEFALNMANIAGSMTEHDALRRALGESAEHFGADTAAIVTGDDVEIFSDDASAAEPAYSTAIQAALQTVQSGQADVFAMRESAQEILAVPLRIDGHLHAVACLMRAGEPFDEEDEDGFELLGRVLELGISNSELLRGMQVQLQGVLALLSTLIEERQSRYQDHSVHVAELAAAVGRHLHLTEDETDDIEVAALLHDVGMLLVPKQLLDPDHELTDEEQLVVRRHPIKGAGIAGRANFSESIQQMILCHHERMNGRGYPCGLSGRDIPLGARIIAVCDSYDAMLAGRHDRPPMPVGGALERLRRRAGADFDPRVVRAFIEIARTHQITITPAGSSQAIDLPTAV